MKTEFTEVSETRKHLAFEVPPDVVDDAIDRVARGYSRSAKVPGFRPGKVPSTVIKQRYREQILSDVAQDLIPRLVGDALRERNLQPVSTPDIREVVIQEGQPLTFVADFETLPEIDPGEYKGIVLRKPPAVLDVGAVDKALEDLRQRAARWHPVEDRPADRGDTLLLDLTRTRRTRLVQLANEPTPLSDDEKPEKLENVSIELGNPANPPGFDENLAGATAGVNRSFRVNYPPEYEVGELAGATVDYDASVKGVRRKELLPLDDEFAKEVSDAETLDGLRDQVRENLQQEAQAEADHKVRHELLRDLASRVRSAPDVLVEHEIDRRLEDFVRRLMEQGIDPMKTEINWQEFRERQKEVAADTVRGTLMLDEIAGRESIEATDEDLEKEIARFAERAGRTPAAVRARLEKEQALEKIRAGIRREKTVAWLLEQANIVQG